MSGFGSSRGITGTEERRTVEKGAYGVITCDECGRENDDEYKFCLGCGAALEASEEAGDEQGDSEMINCPFCGSEQPANFKFCGSCGEQIPDSVAEDGGEAVEEGPAGDRSTAPGKPGGDEAVDPEGASPAETAQGDQPAAADSTPGTAAAGEHGDPPPMPSDLPGATSSEAEPESESVAHLVVIRPDGTEGATIDVPPDKLTIGRENELEALSSDPFLSPRHASILYRDGDFVVQDEESLNGVFREVTDSVQLQDGDYVRVGQELLEFERFDDEPHADDEEPLTAGSSDSEAWGRLRLIAGPEVYTEAYRLDEKEVTIGRESGDIVFKDDGFVSGTHAQVALVEGVAMLRDLNSSNGSFIRIRGEHPLADGERVLMGQQLFRLEVE